MSQLTSRSVVEIDKLVGDELAGAMLQAKISQAAVLCQQVIHSLDNPLLTDEVVRSWRIGDADEVQRALFDNRLLTDELIGGAIAEGGSAEEVRAQQDWDAAKTFCRQATEIEPELAWGWDLLGYAHERAGDLGLATEHYRKGLACSIFTDQTVRVRTHGFNGEGQKFSAARLMALGYEPSGEIERNYFRCLCTPAADRRREQVREHFSRLAQKADAAEAHDLWRRAGWDLGAEPMLAFAELLEQIAESAQAAGRTGQSELAKTHRNCFRDRYGI